MPAYEVILADTILFTLLMLAAFTIANLYPGRIQQSSSAKGNVAGTESQRCYRRIMFSLYVIVLTLGVLLLESMAFEALEETATLPKWQAYLSLEQTHALAWILLWGLVLLLYLAELLGRRYYNQQKQHFPVSPLLRMVLHAIVIMGFSLWIARYVLGWQGVHLLVSSAVLITVAGFFLKNTIQDFLAGISLHLSRSIIPGEWIMLPLLNIEGEVISSNWRETRVRTTGGHLFVIPNSQISTQVFHNMSWPDPTRRHDLDFFVNSHASPADVEEALIGALKASDKVLSDKKSQVIISAFTEYGINYRLRFWSNTFYDRSSMESQIYQAAWDAFAERNITLPLASTGGDDYGKAVALQATGRFNHSSSM